MGTAPPAVRVFDLQGIENETQICVHYLWSGVTIYPESPLPYLPFLAGRRISFLVLFIMIDL